MEKYFEGQLKTIPSDGSRRGSAVVYVYGAPDQDPIIDELFTRRNDLKLRWAHGTEVDDIIGRVTATRFLKDRVEIDFVLFETPTATKVYEMMLTGGVTEFSVGFSFEESDVYEGEDGRWHVRRAELVEVSAVAAGANRETELLAIKSATRWAGGNYTADDMRALMDLPPLGGKEGERIVIPANVLIGGKAGRTISAKNEAALRTALGAIGKAVSDMEAILSALTGSETPQTASQEEAAKAWLEAEVVLWLAAEDAWKEKSQEKDWQRFNAELERLTSDASPVETPAPPAKEPVKVPDYSQRINELLADMSYDVKLDFLAGDTV